MVAAFAWLLILHGCFFLHEKMRRQSGILRVSSETSSRDLLKKLPVDYACRIMEAVTDGLGMAIRLKNAGACIRIAGIPLSSGDEGSVSGSRKRGRTAAASSSAAHQRPIFSDAIDFGHLHDDDSNDGEQQQQHPSSDDACATEQEGESGDDEQMSLSSDND